MDIECPGDVISYNCVIQSNSEYLFLIWRVTPPGMTLFNITYDRFSYMNNEVYNVDNVFRTIQTNYTQDVSIESMLQLTLISNFSLNQTKLECLILGLDSDTVYVDVNFSGKYYGLQKQLYQQLQLHTCMEVS